MRYAMIMAGGAGTRLWPLSRKDRPKQLLDFITRPGSSSQSLLAISAARLEGLIDPANRYICTGEPYRDAIASALPAFSHDRILGEPAARDTVNAVGFAAAILEKRDPDAIFAVLTADHIIEPVDLFQQRMDLGFQLVEEDPTRLVTFTIKPTYAATGYGYVERGRAIESEAVKAADAEAYKVLRFVEKPDVHRAEAYVASGEFGWNSGMFVWKASTVMSCLERFKPESYEGLKKIQDAWDTPDQQRVLEEVYPTLPKISVDYAIMEPATQLKPNDDSLTVCTVMMDLTWLDVGSWPSYAETLEPDDSGNRVVNLGQSDAKLIDSSGNLVVSSADNHTVAILGAENLIVVHTPDATLVMPASKAEELKKLHAELDDDLK
jgi:mannose-1-phosphate guanylyltransferase